MIAPGDRVAVAVSGGADSVALLRLLDELRAELGIVMIVVHFDHRLRGEESEADARFVAKLARARGLEFISESADVHAAAARHRWNLEDAARRLRYGFFDRVVREGRAKCVATAHTADDQAETVLAHLLRGTGPSGLAGIYPVVGSVVRPLLGERRLVLRDYLLCLGQDWREDPTNLDVRRMRARIRLRLVPLLEGEFSPQAVPRLSRLAQLAREEEVLWQALVEERYSAIVMFQEGKLRVAAGDLLMPMGPGFAVRGGGLEKQRALAQRLVRRLYRELRGDTLGLTARHVEQVIRLALQPASGRRLELPAGILVERDFGELIFSRSLPASRQATAISYRHIIEISRRGTADIAIPELRIRFRLKVIDWPPVASETKSDTAFDADLLDHPLVLRNWRPGDAYRPAGHRQARKLKRMFLERKIPVRERFAWPVLESGGRVVWARRMPPGEDVRAREGTRAGVLVEEHAL